MPSTPLSCIVASRRVVRETLMMTVPASYIAAAAAAETSGTLRHCGGDGGEGAPGIAVGVAPSEHHHHLDGLAATAHTAAAALRHLCTTTTHDDADAAPDHYQCYLKLTVPLLHDNSSSSGQSNSAQDSSGPSLAMHASLCSLLGMEL